ncbi:MAG: four helix bundle protein, partial [Deltaproteobacteria bacterium]|nr:four helix bundle protein [Deltaproteobacteria bacterium]
MEDITVWVIERVAKMPRDHKFTVGDKLVETCLEVTTLLVEASFTRDRLGLLGAVSRALTRARVLVRVAQRLGLLSSAQREHFARESVAVGKAGEREACQLRLEQGAGVAVPGVRQPGAHPGGDLLDVERAAREQGADDPHAAPHAAH